MRKSVGMCVFIGHFLVVGSQAFALNGTIIDHRVIEVTEVDGGKVAGKVEISREECQSLAESRGYETGEVVIAEQKLSEAEKEIQENLTGRQVVSRTVNFCLAR